MIKIPLGKPYKYFLQKILEEKDYRTIRQTILWKKLWSNKLSFQQVFKDRFRFLIGFFVFPFYFKIERNLSAVKTENARFIDFWNDPIRTRAVQYYLEKRLDEKAMPLDWKSDLYVKSWADVKKIFYTLKKFLKILANMDFSRISITPIWKFLAFS